MRLRSKSSLHWVVTEDCGDGTQATTRVTVIAGREYESPDLDDVNEFATTVPGLRRRLHLEAP